MAAAELRRQRRAGGGGTCCLGFADAVGEICGKIGTSFTTSKPFRAAEFMMTRALLVPESSQSDTRDADDAVSRSTDNYDADIMAPGGEADMIVRDTIDLGVNMNADHCYNAIMDGGENLSADLCSNTSMVDEELCSSTCMESSVDMDSVDSVDMETEGSVDTDDSVGMDV
ncbi:hypothetical protein PR001_g9437 [Phytophthora rubi]|uniref:Uncharacterized protein n=1 Tax=Phytophthora rubi TaxID=129364 RepID=A0A6A3MUQ9_9STRA|nr:hypothetical protein PR001_g9437 [Phytophthora rubi]